MSIESFEVRTCDRCGFHAEVKGLLDAVGWAKVFAIDKTQGSGRNIGTGSEAYDACPGCAGELFVWWMKPGDVQQPPPVTPPAPAPAPKFTLDDRKALVDMFDNDIRRKITNSIDVIRAEPTMILSGDAIPGAMHGTKELAEDMVSALIGALKTKGFKL